MTWLSAHLKAHFWKSASLPDPTQVHFQWGRIELTSKAGRAHKNEDLEALQVGTRHLPKATPTSPETQFLDFSVTNCSGRPEYNAVSGIN